MATKKQKELMVTVDAKVNDERERLFNVMQKAEIYTSTLDPLFDTYLETFEIYTTMYLRWREAGFPETKRYTNKAGATNASKHPLAQLVEVWSDKKVKALEKLGLTSKVINGNQILGGSIRKPKNDDIENKPEEVLDEMELHRRKWRNKA